MHLIQLFVVIVLLHICTTYVTVLRTCSSDDDKICICLALDLATGYICIQDSCVEHAGWLCMSAVYILILKILATQYKKLLSHTCIHPIPKLLSLTRQHNHTKLLSQARQYYNTKLLSKTRQHHYTKLLSQARQYYNTKLLSKTRQHYYTKLLSQVRQYYHTKLLS